MRRPLSLLIAATVLGALAIVVHDATPEERLNTIASRLEQQVQNIQEVLRAEVDEITHVAAGMDSTALARGQCFTAAQRSQRVERGIDHSVLLNGQLVAWTGNAPITIADSANAGAILRNANGCWMHARTSPGMRIGIHALGLIWYQAPFENRYLKSRFHPSLGVEEDVEASLDAGLGPVVRDRKGDVMFRLQWKGDLAPPGEAARWRLTFMACCLACLFAALWYSLAAVAARGRPWLAAGLVLAVSLMLRWLSLSAGPWSAFTGFAWFDPDLFASSIILPSFGDLLITIALLVFVCAFVRHALLFAQPAVAPSIAAIAGLVVLLLFAAGINEVLVALVRDSRIPLDLFHVQSLDATSITALLAIAFLLFAWVLLADGLVRWMLPRISIRNGLLVAIAVFGAAHILYHLSDNFDSMLVLWPLPLLIALWAMRRGRSRLTNALVMVAALSLFTVHVLNRQTFKRTERDRSALAETAVTREDPVVELLFREARTAIARDPEVVAMFNDSASISTADLDARVQQRFFQSVWNNYDVRLHVFDARGRVRGSTSREAVPTLAELRSRFEQGIPVEGDNLLRNVHRPVERALYIGAMDVRPNGHLVVELHPRVLPEGLGFPELLMAGDRAVERRADRYARARYERGALVESSGAFAFPTRWIMPVPAEGLLLYQDGFELFATGSAATTLVVVASALPTWLDHVTSFSYIFILFAFLCACFLIMRAGLTWRGLPPFGVVTKLRAGILLIACIAIGLFAFGAQHLLGDDLNARTVQQLDERSRSAIAELRQHVHLEQRIEPAMLADMDHWLDKASGVLLADITAYSPEGSLMVTSREQVFTNGLLGTRMDPDAYTAMAIDHRSVYIHDERIGEAEFLAAYRPLLNDRGDVLAYLAVPYFARQSEVEDARAAGYVAIANLFVLLFLIGIGAATFIATWTTLPLRSLKRGLERIQLGARNEPLPYQGDDELGELVRVYNRKVEELRESAEKLARSERESAWKEMAKQVAHEIKNPLTPMKLGIQHFQQTWDPNAPDAKTKLDRFTTSMVEQIDALSRVAGDFSRFAQMSVANETVLDLNEVAKSAVALFTGEPNADIILHASPPLMVKADREHLLRVFNNLLKNALQAVPEDRRGKIDVVLRAESHQAVVEIRDNGTGIPEEVRDRIFEPNFTTKSSGMGLGLAMVKRMVEQAGGSVRFETRVGAGTTFVVILPLTTLP